MHRENRLHKSVYEGHRSITLIFYMTSISIERNQVMHMITHPDHGCTIDASSLPVCDLHRCTGYRAIACKLSHTVLASLVYQAISKSIITSLEQSSSVSCCLRDFLVVYSRKSGCCVSFPWLWTCPTTCGNSPNITCASNPNHHT